MFEGTKLNVATSKMAGEVFSAFGEDVANKVRKIVDDDPTGAVIGLMKNKGWSGMEVVLLLLGEKLKETSNDDPLFSAIECGFIYAIKKEYSDSVPEIYTSYSEREWPY
jgi:hypothetical protein